MLIFVFFLLKGIASRLKAYVNDANSLLDFYYSIGSLTLLKVVHCNDLLSISNIVHVAFEWTFFFHCYLRYGRYPLAVK